MRPSQNNNINLEDFLIDLLNNFSQHDNVLPQKKKKILVNLNSKFSVEGSTYINRSVE